ncbi:MAG: hypothetical protein EA408_04455 [Marinilabiliales bacterium]|nr:MAG: hypothetical protein EA408_04455 [Marinilabiliales bacterium]
MKLIIRIISAAFAVIFLAGAPLLGAYLAGQEITQFLDFPPVTTAVTTEHAPFSWSAFYLFLALTALIIAPFIIKIFTTRHTLKSAGSRELKFPAWGWAGLLLMLAGWLLAWTRFPWFSQLQTHTFTIPWIGYIMLINGIIYKRTGRSLITHEPLYLAGLFLFSAVFWWYFEFLNQFVQNWYYVNVEALGQMEFFLYATVPFATVLPAVISTFRLLKTFRGLSRGLDHFIGIPVARPKTAAVTWSVIAAATLSLTPLLYDYMFPALWLAPLVIIAAALIFTGLPTFLKDITRGNWSTVFLLALSALICGFFWEMWNYYSYTRWEYSVPLVHKFMIFEMPVLGYAGYLPFGIQCGLMGCLVRSITGTTPSPGADARPFAGTEC